MLSRPKLWQWPNVLSIDSALIAVTWQWIFAESANISLPVSAYCVLGLSVWLTYMADRLFDTHQREIGELLSLRHQFAKSYAPTLWRIWAAALILSITLAFTGLTAGQLSRGILLLCVCLTYTFLNQFLSARFFPKEVLVALIFAAGAVVFIESPIPWGAFFCFAALCLLNCLSLGNKERAVDSALCVRSLSDYVSPRRLWAFIIIISIGVGIGILDSSSSLMWSLAVPLSLVSMLMRCRRQIATETYRVFVDAAMLGGILPLLYTQALMASF